MGRNGPLFWVAASLALLVALVYGWHWFAGAERSQSPGELAKAALESSSDLGRHQAAVGLASCGSAGLPEVRRLVRASKDEWVRAICVQGLGDQFDYDGVEVLIAALDDDSPRVRMQAGRALSRLLRRNLRFPAQADSSVRNVAAAKIERLWHDLCRWSAVEHLKANVPMTYFYDLNTGERFEAPSGDGPIAAPSGPDPQGEPAGVRAHVFVRNEGTQEEERFIGYLSKPTRGAGELDRASPDSRNAEDEPLLICRPGDTQWIRTDTPAGGQFLEEFNQRHLAAGQSRVLVTQRKKCIFRAEGETMSVRTSKSGFTIVELLVVVSVIGLLTALLLPAVNRVRTTARSVQCKHNLHNLGAAYEHLANRWPNNPVIKKPAGWIGLLLSTSDSESSVFKCPEDPLFLQPNKDGWANTREGVIARGPMPNDLRLNALEHNSLYTEAVNFTLPDPIQVEFTTPGTFGECRGGTGAMLPAGTKVNVYYAHFDTKGPYGSSQKIHNATMMFTNKILGVMTSGSLLINSDHVFSPGRGFYTDGMWRGIGGKQEWEDTITIGSDLRSVSVDLHTTAGTDDFRIFTLPGISSDADDAGIGKCSYGINGRANRLVGSSSHKILLLDYYMNVADVVGSDAWGVWTNEVAPRHFNMVNVLFADGHVESVLPAKIDPRVPEIHDDLWSPFLDQAN